jgi:4-hydroxy-3-polyprenylbenzoate decarboxylase
MAVQTAMRSYADLREWLSAVDALHELRTVTGADWHLEIGALTELMVRRANPAPALLFDRIKDYPPGYRLLSNSMASPKRLALTFGLPDDLGGVALVDAWRQRIRTLAFTPPREVDAGPVQQNVIEGAAIDLSKLPAPFWHEDDGGRYLGTGCIAITRDPDTGWVNAGTYRMMIQGPDLLGLYRSPGRHATLHEQKYFERGLPFPIAVSLGHDPLLLAAGAASFGVGVNELEWAGAVKGAPIDVLRAPYTGLPVPAASEVVVEGEMLPGEALPEGPYGEWTGYYASDQRPEPFIRVKRVLHRDDPIVLGTGVGGRPDDTDYMNAIVRCALTWNALEAAGVPDVQGVWHLQRIQFCVVAIRQRYPGHAKQAAVLASQAPGTSYLGRYVVVVDNDIDITDPHHVLWAMDTRVDPERDIEIIPRCWSGPLDPIIPPERKGFNSRAIIDATRPYEWRDQFPKPARVSARLEREMIEKWGAEFFTAAWKP